MSYQVLARKWRPRSFREMVGQTHVLKALINALDSQRLHHAYLFTGTRGVGKTTIARILAKCLNCETGISSTPCGTCSVCREIDEGRFIDLIEVDAASRTKVEDTRELLDNVQYSPSRGRFKVYLIDEVHMLSTSSFNALLKTLEEPPPHVKFLLATTDPQKLPVTVLSRCLQFSLKNMPPERVVEHLKHVLSAETIPFEEDALWLLGRAADGSMRDAMSLTDQAIAFGQGKVLAADVRAMLGTLDHGQVYGVLQALLEGNPGSLLEAVRHLAEQGPDWAGVLAEILNVLHRVAIAQVLPESIDNGQGDRDRVLALAQALPGEDVQFYYQLGLIGRRDLPLAPDPRSGFEMVLLRMLAFRPAGAHETPQPSAKAPPLKTSGISQATADSPSGPVACTASDLPAATPPRTSEGPRSIAAPQPEHSAEPPTDTTSQAVINPPWEEAAAPVPTTEPCAAAATDRPTTPPAMPGAAIAPAPNEDASARDDDDEPSPGEYEEYASLAYDFSFSDEPPAAGAEPLPDIQPATGLAAEWLALFPRLNLAGMTASIAANCTLIEARENHWLLHLDPAQGALFNATQQRRLNEALNQTLGRTINLQIELGRPEQETPALAALRQRAECQARAEQSIAEDPIVRQLMELFGASVCADSIEPTARPLAPDARTAQ